MKRPITYRIFSALLALLVLAASVGLTVQRRTCHMSGRSTASLAFTASSAACETTTVAASSCATAISQLREACCDLTTDFHKLSAPAPASLGGKLFVAPIIGVWLSATAWLPFPAAPLLALATVRWHASDASPPPRAGRLLLAFGCVLVV